MFMDSEEHILGLAQFSELEFFSSCSRLFMVSVIVSSCPWGGGSDAATSGAAAAAVAECCWEAAWFRD